MFKVNAQDCIAMALIIGIIILIALGHDSYLYPILTAVTGYYFGRRNSN